MNEFFPDRKVITGIAHEQKRAKPRCEGTKKEKCVQIGSISAWQSYGLKGLGGTDREEREWRGTS